jgi:hypothetical protein
MCSVLGTNAFSLRKEEHMNQYIQLAARLYHFLQEIYGNQPAITNIEVDVEKQSRGTHGAPRLEATNVRVYTGDAQLLPDFEALYWKEVLAAYPHLFQDCQTHQDYLDTVQELLEREQLYLDYGLTWPDTNEKALSPLSFSIEELRQAAGGETSQIETLDEENEDNE